jgi:hypothetical protein
VNGPYGDDRLATLAVGLTLGLLAAAVCLAGWAWWRRRRPGTPAPVAGLALAAAGAVGIARTATTRPAGTLLPGLLVLAVAGAVLRRGGRARGGARPAALAAGGALWLGGGALTGWSLAAEEGAMAAVLVALATCAAGALLDDFDRRRRAQGLAPLLLAVTAGGIYATVPDVEAAVVVVGAAMPMALLGWPFPLAWARPARPPPSLGTPGALATAGLLVWTVAAGSSGRAGPVAGGLACLGLLVAEPLARRLDPRPGVPVMHRRRMKRSTVRAAPRLARRPPPATQFPQGGIHDRCSSPPGGEVPDGPGWRPGWLALAAQALLVALAARLVGRQSSAAGALLLVALEFVVIVALALARERLRATRDTPPPGGDEIPSS